MSRALQAAIKSWFWSEPPPDEQLSDEPPPASRAVRTEFSATVFNGESPEWVDYLERPAERRYERGVAVQAYLHKRSRTLAFAPENDDSRWLSALLDEAFHRLVKVLGRKPHALATLNDLVFDNKSNSKASLRVRLSPHVPSDGTRETARQEANVQGEVRLVLHSDLATSARDALDALDVAASSEERLGSVWAVIYRLIANLAHPTAPRDLFVAKIDVQAKLTHVALNALYDGKKSGRLVPSAVGAVFEEYVSESTGIARADLQDLHPYFRMLGTLSFMLRDAPYASYEDEARIVAREYLDATYLRLSLAGAMPPVAPAMQAMNYKRHGHGITTPAAKVGSYGILDLEDLSAWRAIELPLRDLGFTPLRQLGIGEFGRVYEVLNDNNPSFPSRLALKIDRIVGKKKNAILEAEAAMLVGRALARSPHVIRLYDTGKLAHQRFTFHVLQLIDGDTLDNLIGVTGREHASVSRPPAARSSQREAEQEYARAVNSHGSELWRRRRLASPFTQALSPTMVLDLLTSVLLWLEEVHELGYAINDLKNGNLMMSRRGQLKGIDLDSYAPVHSPRDKMTDFMFLAVSLILLLFSAPVLQRGRAVPWEELIQSESRLRSALNDAWPFGDVETLSDGRVTKQELLDLLVDLVHRSRHLDYARKPDLYSDDVARLLRCKRRLLIEEWVID